jgi:FtsP/CotA-like multicopper oxidase with cupredoxin domain
MGLLPAEMVRGHPKQQPEVSMHGGVAGGSSEYHLVIALFDAKTRERITKAEIRAVVSEIGLAGEETTLEPMEIAEAITFGNYVRMAGTCPALTGSMGAYDWGINGTAYGHETRLTVGNGERVELVMTNRTTMSHPMHLHGHVFQVVAVNGKRFSGAMRDTVLVPPMASVTVAFDADNPGRWVFHCHNLYHMEAGMMTTVEYES